MDKNELWNASRKTNIVIVGDRVYCTHPYVLSLSSLTAKPQKHFPMYFDNNCVTVRFIPPLSPQLDILPESSF